MNKKYLLLLLTIVLFCAPSQHIAQEYLQLIQNPTPKTTLNDVKQAAESYFSGKELGRGSGFKQYKRWEHKMERLVNPDGIIAKNFNRMNLEEAIRVNAIDPTSNNTRMSGWTALGPTSYTNGPQGYNGGVGRVNVVGFHPTDANTIYVGTPAGGLWKSVDGGANWTPMSDALASIGVSGIAVDHAAPETVYILTGDGDGADTRSIGVMKSIDGGATWAATGLSWGLTQNRRGYKLLMHPTNSNIMFIVTTNGIYKTDDGWATWSNVQGGSFRDIEFKPGDPSTVYAVTTNTFYRSTDTGTNWSVVSSGLPSGERRVALAVTPSNPNYVYYLAGGNTGVGQFRGIYRSTDSGVSFSTRTTTPNILGYSTVGSDDDDQTWYDIALAANPAAADNILTGGINVWRSTDGGATLNAISKWNEPTGSFEYVHADIHELAYNPVDGKLYVGSDGGVSVSSDNGQTFTNIWNGLQIMQLYRIDGIESNQNLLVGGAQDNGSNVYSGTPAIKHIYGADGMDCMIDYNNPNNMYFAVQNGNFRKSTNGGDNTFGIRPAGSTGAWVTPYGMDATDPNIIYGGYSDVYRSTNGGGNWTNIGSDGRGALAIGVNDGARLYAANGSGIQMSANTGGSWTTVTGSWPSLTITSIALDPADATHVWVTLGGYSAGQKVYESTNAGTSWTNVSGTLPNLPAHSIAFENTGGTPANAIYVGMSVGVYYKSDVTPWQLHETGLPNTPIYDLEINHTNGKIRAGTFGRGIWEAPLFNAVVCDLSITDVTATSTSCPSSSDGTVTITATCPSCTGIEYTLTPTAPAGPAISQTNNPNFVGLAANSYDVTAADTGDPACSAAWPSNPVVVDPGSESVPPVITCISDITQANDPGMCDAIVTYTAPVGTDNCPGAITMQTAGLASGSTFPVGVTINTFEVTDSSGNTASCSFIVTVEDSEPPVAICQDITVQLDSSGFVSIGAFDVDGGSTDNCSVASSSIDISMFNCSNVGANNVVLTITDPAGNSSSCTAVVTVEDITPPVVNCQDITISLDASGNATIVAADVNAGATDACGIDMNSISIDVDTFDCTNIGTNNVTLFVTDVNGNTGSCIAVVTVEDNEPPIAVCQDITVQLDAAGTVTILPADVDGGSTDACGAPSLSLNNDTFDCSDVGTNNVILTVTDVNGNVSTCTAVVTVEDMVVPSAICQDITIQLDASGTASIEAADVDGGSIDACGIDTLSIDIDTFDCSNIGTNNVTLTILDINGNEATCVAVVTVEEENAIPLAVCQNITVPLQADGTATIDASSLDGGSSGMGCFNGMTIDINSFDCSDVGTPVQVTLMVMNGNGNTDTCIATVTVVDSLDPTIECPDDITVSSEGAYTLPDYFAEGIVTVADNCENDATVTQQPVAGTELEPGAYNITIEVSDPSGNTDTCLFRLTIEDLLGVSEQANLSSLLVYPNPADQEFVIANPKQLALKELAIYDITGRLLQAISLEGVGIETRVNISDFASATYLLVVRSEIAQTIKYLIKE